MKRMASFIAVIGIIFGITAAFDMTQTLFTSEIIAEAAETDALPAPSGLKVKEGNGKVTLTWNSVNGADAYKVYMYDTGTKKYQAVRTVSGTKAVINSLINGTAYKFKVAAAVKKNKKYSAGKTSAAVSATPSEKPVSDNAAAKPAADNAETKPESNNDSAAEKPILPKTAKMNKANISAEQMKGVWLSYDFLPNTNYTEAGVYDPDNKIGIASPFHNVIIRSKDKAVFYYNSNNYDGKEWRITADIAKNTFKTADEYSFGYEIYTYKNVKYMLVNWQTDSEKDNTAIFRYTEISDIKTDAEAKQLEGTWTSIDYTSDIEKYDPARKEKSGSLFLKSIAVKGGKVVFNQENGKVNYTLAGNNSMKDSHSPRKYILRQINGETYMFLEWSTGRYYVFTKTSDKAELSSADFTFGYSKLFEDENKKQNPEIDGTWTSIDFFNTENYSDPTVDYNPRTVYNLGPLYLQKFDIKHNAVRFTTSSGVTTHPLSKEHSSKNSSGSVNLYGKLEEYYIYSANLNTYLLYRWAGNGFYVLQKTSDITDFLSDTKAVTNKAELKGEWEGVTFWNQPEIESALAYNTENKNGNYGSKLYKSASINEDKITLTSNKGTEETLSIDSNRIGGDKYYAYMIDGKTYLFYEYATNYGVEGICVFRKK